MTMLSCRTAGRLILAVALYVASVYTAMHVVEPEFDPIRTPMSIYVLGPHGAWMTTTYFALCAAWIGIAYGFAQTLTRTRLTAIAFFLLVIALVGALIAGVFPMDPLTTGQPADALASEWGGGTMTFAGRMHAGGAPIAFPAIALTPLLFSLAFRSAPRWRTVFVPALALASGVLVALALAIVSLRVFGFAGYVQRVFFLLLLSWMIVVGRQLTRFPTVIGNPS